MKRIEYNPDFPKTLQGAIRLIADFEKEYVKETTQFCKGVRYGASYSLVILRQLKNNLKK